MLKNQTRAQKVLNELTERLSTAYPSPQSELRFSNEYQLVVSVILSAQCTDRKVNEVTPALFERYPEFQTLSGASLRSVEAIIRPVNFYKTKAANLVRMAKMVCSEFNGSLPHSHSELITLPGVGNKTANVVLSELGAEATFPVDTHVFRVSKRLGLSSGKNVITTEKELKEIFEPSVWRPMHHWLILHGRRVCKALRPNCSHCPLSSLCPKITVSSPSPIRRKRRIQRKRT